MNVITVKFQKRIFRDLLVKNHMITSNEIAAAIWSAAERTLRTSNVNAPVRQSDIIAASVWAYSSRTLTDLPFSSFLEEKRFGAQYDLPLPTISIAGANFGTLVKKDFYTYEYSYIPRVSALPTIILDVDMQNAEIRYSLSGRSPTAKSYLYTGPFSLQNNKPSSFVTTIKIRAYGYRDNKTSINDKSPVVIAHFCIVQS